MYKSDKLATRDLGGGYQLLYRWVYVRAGGKHGEPADVDSVSTEGVAQPVSFGDVERGMQRVVCSTPRFLDRSRAVDRPTAPVSPHSKA